MLTEEQKAQLDNPLDPQLIEKNPKGFDYIEGHVAKRHANGIFGFDGWSYTIDRVQEIYTGEHKDKKGNIMRKVSYTAQVQVSALGITRQDVGYGSGFGPDDGDASEGAIKEAVTDGLKRALVSFGDQFALGLYGKRKGAPQQQRQQQQSQQQQAPPPEEEPPKAEPTIREWFDGQIAHYRMALGADFDAEVKRRGVNDIDAIKTSGDAKALIAGLKNEVDKRAAA